MQNYEVKNIVILDNFFNLLKERKISAKKLSEDTGISTGNISDWKNGRSMPTAVKLIQLANYLDCSVDFILGRTDIVSSSNENTLKIDISEQERKLLSAYRQNPNMQSAVNKLLSIEQPMRAIKIARSNTSKVEEITGDFSDLFNAPRVLSDDDI